jgi:hypothetical protein
LGNLRADVARPDYWRLDVSGSHGGSGGISLGPHLRRIFIAGLIVILGPGIVRATYRVITAEYAAFDFGDLGDYGDVAYKFVADMNLWLAPTIWVFVAVWAVVFIFCLWFNLL